MIFFDLDGTLLDFKTSEYLGVKEFYREYGDCLKCGEETFYKLWCEVSDKHFDRYLKGEISFTRQRNERIKELFSISGIIISEEEAENRFKKYSKIYEESWRSFEDVIPCLSGLLGYKLGIISNGDYEQQLFKLERMGIKGYFDIFVIAGDVGVAKPDLRIFEIACQKANKRPEDCFYIGDLLETDIIPCNEAGMTGIWINRKSVPQEVPNGVIMIDSLLDIKEIISR